jgi:quinol-cytochrome oxidoreductase complex cytochrome b subunit
VGQEALTRFYALHIMALPVGLTLLISLHLWRVRKDGGLAANEGREEADPTIRSEAIISPPTETEGVP